MASPPPRWLVNLNRAMLRRGLEVGSQHLLTAPGRTSGVPRSTPISIVTLDGQRYIVSAFADADWVKNVRAAGSGSISRGRQSETVTLIEVPVEDRDPILRAFLEQVPGGRRFFESPAPDAVVASADRYPVFRIAPDGGSGVSSSA